MVSSQTGAWQLWLYVLDLRQQDDLLSAQQRLVSSQPAADDRRVPSGPDNIVGQNYVGTPSLRWARSATKHRISRERSRYVIEHCGLRFDQDPPGALPDRADSRLVFLGDDAAGVALEVMAIELESTSLLVIHAMVLRDRYREQYEEARQWQS